MVDIAGYQKLTLKLGPQRWGTNKKLLESWKYRSGCGSDKHQRMLCTKNSFRTLPIPMMSEVDSVWTSIGRQERNARALCPQMELRVSLTFIHHLNHRCEANYWIQSVARLAHRKSMAGCILKLFVTPTSFITHICSSFVYARGLCFTSYSLHHHCVANWQGVAIDQIFAERSEKWYLLHTFLLYPVSCIRWKNLNSRERKFSVLMNLSFRGTIEI